MTTGNTHPPDDQSNPRQSPFHPQTWDDPQQAFPTEPFQSWKPLARDNPSRQTPFPPRQFKPLFHPAQHTVESDQPHALDTLTQPIPTPPLTSHLPSAHEPTPSDTKSLPAWIYLCTTFLLLLLIIVVSYTIVHVGLLSKEPTSPTPGASGPTIVEKKSHAPSKQGPTQQPPSTVISHGTPHIGGPTSDFVGKYGQPLFQSIEGGQNFFADKTQTIDLSIRKDDDTQQVTYLAIVGPLSWSESQTKAYCTQFLPGDAQQINVAANLTTYQSRVGEVVLTMNGVNMCLLTIATS